MVVILLLFTGFNLGYMTDYCYGYFMYLLVTEKIMDEIPN